MEFFENNNRRRGEMASVRRFQLRPAISTIIL